jgi:hypothetical protein
MARAGFNFHLNVLCFLQCADDPEFSLCLHEGWSRSGSNPYNN